MMIVYAALTAYHAGRYEQAKELALQAVQTGSTILATVYRKAGIVILAHGMGYSLMCRILRWHS